MLRYATCQLFFFIFAFVMMDYSYADESFLDEKGIICSADTAVASREEKEHGWPPNTERFWFENGRVFYLSGDKVIETRPLVMQSSKFTNYFSNDKEVWFDFGYTYSIHLQTLQLFRVISMGGETKLRNTRCAILPGASFWETTNSSAQ